MTICQVERFYVAIYDIWGSETYWGDDYNQRWSATTFSGAFPPREKSHNQHFAIVMIFPIIMHDDALTPENLPQLSLQLKVVSLEKVPGDQPTQVLD